jgi:hypothetical protein
VVGTDCLRIIEPRVSMVFIGQVLR